jgi:hypothetical protein
MYSTCRFSRSRNLDGLIEAMARPYALIVDHAVSTFVRRRAEKDLASVLP